MTPEMVHYGKAERVITQRQIVLASAFDAHPERFVRGLPVPPSLPEAAWINRPKIQSQHLALAENISNTEVLGYGPTEDRLSWRNMENDFSSQSVQLTENNTKFESEVSQNH